MKQKDELRAYLTHRLEEHSQRVPEDNKSLMGALMEWGANLLFEGRLYDGIRGQIEHQARMKKISPKAFIDYLFKQKNYDAWMRVFQS